MSYFRITIIWKNGEFIGHYFYSTSFFFSFWKKILLQKEKVLLYCIVLSFIYTQKIIAFSPGPDRLFTLILLMITILL